MVHFNATGILQVIGQRRAPTMADCVYIGITLHPNKHLSHLKVHKSHLMHTFNWNQCRRSADRAESAPVELVEVVVQRWTTNACRWSYAICSAQILLKKS